MWQSRADISLVPMAPEGALFRGSRPLCQFDCVANTVCPGGRRVEMHPKAATLCRSEPREGPREVRGGQDEAGLRSLLRWQETCRQNTGPGPAWPRGPRTPLSRPALPGGPSPKFSTLGLKPAAGTCADRTVTPESWLFAENLLSSRMFFRKPQRLWGNSAPPGPGAPAAPVGIVTYYFYNEQHIP